MATGRRKPPAQASRQEVYKNYYLFDVKVWMYDTIDRNNILNNGMLAIDVSEGGSSRDREIIEYPLTSVWLNPIDPDEKKTCKAYAAIPQNPTNAAEKKAKDFVEELFKQSSIRHHGSTPVHAISVDAFKKIFRYGAERDIFITQAKNDWSAPYTPIFDNKALAIQAVMASLEKYTTAKVAGLDLINLNSLSDTLLEELGFVKIVDQLGIGVPMWMGDADKALSMGSVTYGRNNWGRTSHEEETEKATSMEVVESFLDLLESELTDKTQELSIQEVSSGSN